MDQENTYQLNNNVILAEIDDQFIGMSIEGGCYLRFGEVGTDIIKYLQSGLNQEEIIAKLLEEYDVEQETCRKETSQFFEKLSRLSIIESLD